jgi:hypothetical protein
MNARSPAPLPPAPSPTVDAAPERPPRGKSGGWAGGVALALLLYVLSCGPVASLTFNCQWPLQVLWIYAPIEWGVTTVDDVTGSTVARDCLDRYITLCGFDIANFRVLLKMGG